MTDVLTLAIDLTAGLVLGAIFYGGLWWTVRRVCAGAAGLWLVASFLVRSVVALAGFYAIARATWSGALACLAGFFVARIAVTRFTRERSAASAPLAACSAAEREALRAGRLP
jgi:F1F0 ATPase subunit 2